MTAKYSYTRLGTIEEEPFPCVSEAAKKAMGHYKDEDGMNSDCIPLWIDAGDVRVWDSDSPHRFELLKSWIESGD